MARTASRTTPPVRALGWLVVLVGLAFAVTTVPGVRAEPGFWVPVDGWLQGSGYALIALLVVLRPLLVRRTRPLWELLATAVTLRCLGFLVFLAHVRTLAPRPYPSLADALWVSSSVLFLLAIGLRARYRGKGLSRLLALDGFIAAFTVAGVSVALLWGSLVTLSAPEVPNRAVALNLTYPTLDIVALVLIVGLLASGWRPNRAEGLIVTGVAVIALVSAIYVYQVAAGLFRPGTVLSALSFFGTAVVALAAWLPHQATTVTAADDRPPLPPRPTLAVPLTLAGVCLAALLVIPYTTPVSPLAVALLVLALALMLVRGMLTLAQHREQAEVLIASQSDEILNFQMLVEASGDFVAIASLDGRVSFVNPAGRRMVGLAPDDDVTTATIADFLTAEARRLSTEDSRPAVLARGHWEGQSTLLDRRGGPPIPVMVSTFLMRHPVTRQPFAMATVQRDISARINAEEAMADLARQRQQLLSRLVLAQEDERSRIAADVHDDSVQAIAAVDLTLGMLRRQLRDSDPSVLRSVTSAHDSVTGAATRLRHLLFDLESPAQHARLGAALHEAAGFVFEDGPESWQVTGDTGVDLPHAQRVTAYRVAKEALVNVRKHAGADHVEIRLEDRADGVYVAVRDDGCGADAGALRQRPGHLGLAAMRDRAAVAGGRLHVTSAPGEGTEVALWIPHQPDTL